MDNTKGQGATEYLILLGAVLVVALGVITLLGFFPGMIGDATLSESQLYWRGSARPISVIEEKNINGTICAGTGAASGYRLVLVNINPDPIYLTNISLDGTPRTFCASGATLPAASLSIGPGQVFRIDAVGPPCTPGKAVEMQLAFTYDTPYLEGKTQAGAKKLSFKCSDSTIVAVSCGDGTCTSEQKCCDCAAYGCGNLTCAPSAQNCSDACLPIC